MDNRVKKELIVKTALELLQNVLPTNITENLEKLGESDEPNGFVDDMDEARFIYEKLSPQFNNDESVFEPIIEPVVCITQIDPNASLTYFEIVEQEMMLSLPVTKENITILKYILGDFPEISSTLLSNLKLQTLDQLTNLLVYALMTSEHSKETELTLFLEPGTVNKALEALCDIIAEKKHAFIHWPNKREIEQNVRLFESYQEYGYYEFFNVFGAIGTLEIRIQPALPNYLPVSKSNRTYTPIKWQCSSDTGGILQSSFVLLPKKENETKNSYVFEVNPVKVKLEAMKSDEVYLVADETLTLFPYLLTPHEKLIIRAEEHNRALESKRKIIDNVFGKIQSRFLILQRIELRSAKSISNLIETVGILHNFFMVHNDHLYISE